MTRDIMVAAAGQRPVSRVNGNLASVRTRRSGSSAALEAELQADPAAGLGLIRLVWMGQRRITGIEPGRSLTVEGVPVVQRGRATIYNPRYQLG